MTLENRVAGKPVVACFDGGHLSSDGGLLLLRELDHRLGLTAFLSGCVRDRRSATRRRQSVWDLMCQRVYGLACGYEDCNDFDTLREDGLFKMSVGRDPEHGRALASQPTLSRFENSITRADLYRLSQGLVDHFLKRHANEKPRQVVIDLDATDDPTHGQQQFEFFHGFYGRHCYLPLIACVALDAGEQEVVGAVLRPGNVHAGRGTVAILKRLVGKLRSAFPEAEIVFRADAGFALPKVYEWCERAGVKYVISLPKNNRVEALALGLMREARRLHAATGEKVRHFGEVTYAAETWERERRVVVKAEILEKGENPRFVVTNLERTPAEVYRFYTGRGDMENRIKEAKIDLDSGRTSCHLFTANHFRLLLSTIALTLMQAMRKMLAGTDLQTAQAGTLRTRLLKVAGRIVRTTRRIVVHLPSSYPWHRYWVYLLEEPLGSAAPV